MAFRVSFFFFTVMLGSVLVNGQPPMGPASPPDPQSTPTTPPTPSGVTPPTPSGVTPPTPSGVTPPTPSGVTPPTPSGVTPPPPPTTSGGTSPSSAGASGLPPVTAAPECAALATKCIDDIPFATGESIYWLGKIYVGAVGATGATPGATPPPPTTPGATPPPPTTLGATPPPPTTLGATPPPPTTPGATPPPTTPGAPATPCTGGDNKCSITSYTPDTCQAIKILISRNEDGSICMKEAAFNKATNTVALFKNAWFPADPQKAILKQFFGYYGTMDQSGTVKIVDPSAADIKSTQAVDFVLVAASEGGEWAVFSTCCKSVVFVIYSDAIVCAKSMKTFDAVITPLIAPLGIQFTNLKDVPTEMSIKLDNFIPALPPAPAAPATSATTTGPAGPLPATSPSGTPLPGATPPPAAPGTPPPGAPAPSPQATPAPATPPPAAP